MTKNNKGAEPFLCATKTGHFFLNFHIVIHTPPNYNLRQTTKMNGDTLQGGIPTTQRCFITSDAEPTHSAARVVRSAKASS